MPLPAVVPAPASISADAAAAPFALSADVVVSGDADACAAFVALVRARTGVTLSAGEDGTVVFRIEPAGAAESYRIVADAASVTVTAPDEAGLFYGAQTLGQLITAHDRNWVVPAVEVDDAPRFAYRGVMLDVARHFFDVDTVTAYIDRAAGLKFNVLHLHLSDDQGWRIHLDARPELAARASATAVGGGEGGHFTKADYAAIVEHAASRHVTVVPEIDMPGHTHAVGLAHPDLVEAPALSDEMRSSGEKLPVAGEPYEGIAVGFSSLRIDNEATYDFVADVVGELAAMTPGPYLHIGGDESLATDPDDFSAFIDRATCLVADLGKIPITWHEAGSAARIHDTTIGQYWGFLEATAGMDDQARAFVGNGSQVILSPADAVYLDMKYDLSTPLGLAWANGPTSVRRAYSWEPTELIEGIGEDDILGVEAPLWAETLRTLDDIDTMAFPRLAAAAEAAWSPAAGTTPLRTWDSFRSRVGSLGQLWSSLGIHYFRSPEIEWAAE